MALKRGYLKRLKTLTLIFSKYRNVKYIVLARSLLLCLCSCFADAEETGLQTLAAKEGYNNSLVLRFTIDFIHLRDVPSSELNGSC